MAVYVTDTHPLLWYASGHHAKLSKKALRIFNEAVRDRALIYVPAVVLWEIALLNKSRRIQLREPFDQWAAALLARRGFDLAPLDLQVVAEAINLTFNDDPFDAVIVATAKIKDLSLITKDVEITNAQVVEVAW